MEHHFSEIPEKTRTIVGIFIFRIKISFISKKKKKKRKIKNQKNQKLKKNHRGKERNGQEIQFHSILSNVVVAFQMK